MPDARRRRPIPSVPRRRPRVAGPARASQRRADDEHHEPDQRERQDRDQNGHAVTELMRLPTIPPTRARQARARPRRARARERTLTRRRTTLGAGQIAISPPPKLIRPPIQIHITSGETRKLNCAGGGCFR